MAARLAAQGRLGAGTHVERIADTDQIQAFLSNA
jgi:hypothetical protein